MLLDGLRSCEILSLQLEDLKLADAQLRVLGKGRKQRTLPLPGEIMEVLQSYLRLERPLTNSPYLFISLKGRRRGQPMTPAGLRSLFRHHRLRSTVPSANPHRFRHTFGADMVRAGISLPALQHLMGHSQIHTTMLYVELAPQDVWREYARAVANRTHLPVPLRKCHETIQTELWNKSFRHRSTTLSLTLQPFTVVKYQYVARYFVGYLRAAFPQVRRLSQLRRDPHMLGLFRWLCELRPPIGNHYAPATSALSPPIVKRPGRSRPPLQPGLIIPEDLPDSSRISPQTSVPGR